MQPGLVGPPLANPRPAIMEHSLINFPCPSISPAPLAPLALLAPLAPTGRSIGSQAARQATPRPLACCPAALITWLVGWG